MKTIYFFNRALVVKLAMAFLMVMMWGEGWGQAVGDYKTVTGATTWTTLASWLRYNGTTWVQPTTAITQGYPGQYTGAGTVTILNNITFNVSPAQSIGALDIQANFTPSNAIRALTVTGNFSISAGTLSLSNNNNVQTTLTIGGNFTMTGGTITEGANTHGAIIFNKAGTQTFTKSAGTISNTINFSVNSGSILNMGTNILNGSSGTFTLSSGAGIIIGDPYGITTATTGGTGGNIQVTGARTYNTGANYTYAGTVNQVTGNGLTQNTPLNLTINNPANTVTLSANTNINGALTVNAGSTLALSTYTLGSPTTTTLYCGATTGSTISGSGLLTLGGNVTVTDDPSIGTNGATISCPVALGGNRTFTVADDGSTATDLTLSGIVSGANFNLIKDVAGTMELSASNTYTGTTTASAGILRATNNTVVASTNGPFGNNASGLNLGGGIIQSNVATFSRPLTVTVTNSGLDAYGSARTINSNINNATGSTLNLNIGGITASSAEGQDMTLSGVLSNTSGTLDITKLGTSIVTVSGANSYTGTTTISAGTLITGAAVAVSTNGPLGNATSSITLGDANTTTNNSSPTLLIGGSFGFARTVTIANQATSGIYSVGANTNNNSTFSGSITINKPLTVTQVATTSTNTLTISGGITTGNAGSKNLTFDNAGTVTVSTTAISDGTGSIACVKQNSGTLNLNVASTYTSGTTLSAGTLNINNSQALGTSAGTFTINGGTIDNTSGAAITTLNYPQIWGGDFVFTGTKDLNLGTGTVSMSASRQVTTNGGILTVEGVISGNTFGITKAGTAVLTLSGASTYTGTTTISAGTLKLGATGDATNTPLGTTGAGTSVTSGAVLDLNGFTLGTAEALTLNGTGISSGGALINSSGSAVTYIGVITLGSASSIGTTGDITLGSNGISGGQDLTKVGAATLSLGSGTATINGLTIGAGTLTSTSGTLNIAGSFTNNGTFTHNSGTVNFNGGGAQATSGSSAPTFNNLIFSNSGTKTFGAATTINGNLSISGTAAANLGTGLTHSANTLTLGGAGQPNGSWGSTAGGCPATYKNDPYFGSTATGILNVTTSSCTTGTWLGTTDTDWNVASNWCGGIPTSATNVVIPSGGNQPVISAAAVCNNITINGSALLSITGTNTLTISGDFINNGTFTASNTSTVIFDGAAQNIPAVTFNNLTLSGSGIKTFTVTTVNGNLTLSGTATATTGAALAIGGNLDIGTGTVFATGATATWTLGVTGTTSVSGTLTLDNTGTKTFTNNVTVNSGGVWNETGVAAINYAGSLQNDGTTFTANTGVHTFSGATKTISGTTAIAIPNLTISGATTNNGTLTVSTALAGASTLTNGATGTLKYGGASITPTLTATAAGNTVNYTGAAQAVKATTYSNLILSGSNTKTFGAATTIGANLSISGSANADLGIFTSSANTLTLGGTGQPSGSWGSTAGGCLATYKNSAYFGTTATGILNVGTSSCIAGTWLGYISTDWGTALNWCGGVPTSATNVVIPSGGNQPVIGAAAVCKNITINTGATLAITGSNTLTVSGNWTNSGTLIPNTSTVTFNAAGSQTIDQGTFYNITNSSANLIAGSGTISVAKDWTNTGTFTCGTSTVNYNGTAQQMAGVTYYRLTISGGNIKTLQNSATVNNIFTLTSGVVQLGSNNFTLNNSTNTASISGGSATSYVNTSSTGQFICNLYTAVPTVNIRGGLWFRSATYTYPIGDAACYAPVALSIEIRHTDRDTLWNGPWGSPLSVGAQTFASSLPSTNGGTYLNRNWQFSKSGNLDAVFTGVFTHSVCANEVTGTESQLSLKYRPIGSTIYAPNITTVAVGPHTLTSSYMDLAKLVNFEYTAFNDPSCTLNNTGPGGVGDAYTNVLWLKGDGTFYDDNGVVTTTDNTQISRWDDASGNYNNAYSPYWHRPLYRTNIFKGYSALQFRKSRLPYSPVPASDNGDDFVTPCNLAIPNNISYTAILVFTENPGFGFGGLITNGNGVMIIDRTPGTNPLASFKIVGPSPGYFAFQKRDDANLGIDKSPVATSTIVPYTITLLNLKRNYGTDYQMYIR